MWYPDPAWKYQSPLRLMEASGERHCSTVVTMLSGEVELIPLPMHRYSWSKKNHALRARRSERGLMKSNATAP